MKTEKIKFDVSDTDRLLLRILTHQASRKEIIFFFRWINNGENREYFEKFKKVWHMTLGVHASPELLEDGLEDYYRFMKKSSRRKLQMKRVLLQIASVIIIGLIGIFSIIWSHRDTTSRGNVEVCRDKTVILTLSDGREIDMIRDSLFLTREVGKFVQLHKINQREIVYEMCDSLMLADQGELIYNEIIVPAGERIFVQLSDGTKVWVNSESSIRYPVCFGKVNREVEVRGNLYFEVAKDSARPFIAIAREIKTEVLGTSFEVNTYGDRDEVSATLVEGSVRVDAGNHCETICPDQQFLFHTNSGEYEIQNVNAVNKIRWKDGILVIDNESFDDLVWKLERWYGVAILNETGIIFNQSFSGEFAREDIQHAIETICENLNISYSMEKDRILLKR